LARDSSGDLWEGEFENLALFAQLYGARDVDMDHLLHRMGLDGRGRDRIVPTPCPASVLRSESGNDRCASEQRDNEQHNKDEKQKLGDRRGRTGNAPKTKKGSDNSNDEKENGPIKHLVPLHATRSCRR
jgi:hypothetical protein